MAALAAQSGGFLTLLKKRNFLRIWLAQLLSQTIFFAANYALLILIENITHSATMVGISIICFSLPAVIFGAPAGVLVDRMNKRRVLWSSNVLRAIVTLFFVIVLLFDRGSLLVPIYLLTFLSATIGQFFSPAEGSSIPLLVNEDELMPALSLFNVTFMLSQALGFILLAPLALTLLPTITINGIIIDSIASLYILVALLYLVCAGLILLIPRDKFLQSVEKDAPEPVADQTLGALGNAWTEMVQGWNFVRRNNQLFLAVAQLSFAGVLILVISQLATPIVTQLLLLPANAMAIVFAPAGIGLVLGSVLMPHISRRLGKSLTILIGIIVISAATFLLPVTTVLARFLQPHGWNTNPLLLFTMALLMFIAGIALDCINIPAQTAIQELTPDWIKARVLALQIALYSAFSIPIIPAIGAIADQFGLDRAIYLLSAGEIAFGVWGFFYQRAHPHLPSSPNGEEKPDSTKSDEIDTISPQSH